jgi:hypothetical protein
MIIQLPANSGAGEAAFLESAPNYASTAQAGEWRRAAPQ